MVNVTSYLNPDLDGVACSIAYSELLNKKGIPAHSIYSGELSLEVKYVQNHTHVFPIEKSSESSFSDVQEEYVLVDAADPASLDPHIDPNRVIEIFDHRQLVFTDRFINARKHIELVGACATLITEEYLKFHISPSLSSSIFLYSAIVSNTINFQNSVTTIRDINAASWLQLVADLGEEYIRGMFLAKSKITKRNLYTILSQDFALKSFEGKRVGIAQIEMVDINKLTGELRSILLNSLERLKSENKLDYLLFSGIDVIKGFNLFFVIDPNSQKLFSRALDMPDLKLGTTTHQIIMRKQIWPKVEAAMI